MSWEVEFMLEDRKRLVYKQPSESKQVNFTNNLTKNQYKKEMFSANK